MEFEGITLGEYYDIFDSIYKNPDNPAVPFLRYVIALTRCDLKDVKKLVKLAVGKYMDEIKVPISDEEEDYILENQDEDC